MSMQWLRDPGMTQWALLVRLLLAGVFIPEGIQKLIFPDAFGAGRFTKIGIPYPDIMGPFVGWVELICGAVILIGWFSRAAAVPLIVIMIVAITSTKLPILLGQDWLIFKLRELDTYGFWSMAHETRTDWAMLLGAAFILLSGSGRWSIDAARFGPIAPSTPL